MRARPEPRAAQRLPARLRRLGLDPDPNPDPNPNPNPSPSPSPNPNPNPNPNQGGSCTIDGDALLAGGGQRQHGHRIPPNQRFHHMSDEDIHFECSFANQWPGAIVGWKMPENGDCRGLVSLNLVQAVLNRIVRK